ncbi:MAG TPA: diadenylate cyclase [Candidatus Eisenbacteria bacterium]|nr:diadenylate cyclase [Candidatus Eisenbacteria bacterium]
MDGTFWNLLRGITISEVIDIILVSVILYTGIVWAQRTRAAFVVRGIAILGGIYLIARQLDLEMIAWLFQGFFAIFLVMIVVIFQEELRQMFERIAVWSLTGKRVPALASTTVDILVRTVADLAKDRVGALIVLRGNDPLERHITGGIALDGRLSEPLLRSLFDTHSPGHDGAVVVENDRITRFAAHLPLSKDLRQLRNLGTRHSAALGLAELTDAFCIVVSEERGTVSVARDGRLQLIDNLQALGGAIQTFLREKFPPPVPRKPEMWLEFFRKNWPAKALAVSLAIGFWYVLVPGSKIVQVSYRVPVSVQNLPANMKVEDVEPSAVNVTFSGPRRAFYLFDPKRVSVNLDASLAELGRRTFTLSERNVAHPADISVQDLSPSTVRLSLRKVEPQETTRG